MPHGSPRTGTGCRIRGVYDCPVFVLRPPLRTGATSPLRISGSTVAGEFRES